MKTSDNKLAIGYFTFPVFFTDPPCFDAFVISIAHPNDQSRVDLSIILTLFLSTERVYGVCSRLCETGSAGEKMVEINHRYTGHTSHQSAVIKHLETAVSASNVESCIKLSLRRSSACIHDICFLFIILQRFSSLCSLVFLSSHRDWKLQRMQSASIDWTNRAVVFSA